MDNKTLFIDESPVFGGHEEMFLRLLTTLELPATDTLTVLVNARNQPLIDALERLQSQTDKTITVLRHPFRGWPVRPLTNLLAWGDARALWRILKQRQITRVVVVQGTIEIGGLSLLISRLAGCEVISYLPITKRSRLLGVTLGGLRDWLNRWFYYPLPHRFITLSEFNRRELENDFAVAADKITLVYNFDDQPVSAEAAELPPGIHFLLIGRVDFLQKRQQDFLRALVQQRTRDDLHLHIVGDSDSAESQALRAEFQHDPQIIFHGWCDAAQVAGLIAAADGVILPSRFEGVPLTMIQAIQQGRRVFGSDVDGMREFLPARWRFPQGDFGRAVAMMESVARDPGADTSLLRETQQQFAARFNRPRAAAAFQQAVSGQRPPAILLDCRLMSERPTGISRYSEKFLAYYLEKYGAENITALVNQLHPAIPCRQQVTPLKAFNLLHWLRFPGWLARQHYTHYISFHYSGLARRVAGVKSAVTVHDLMFERVPNFFSGTLKKCIGKRYFRLLVGRSLAVSDLIFSVSETTRRDVKDLYGRESAVSGEGMFLSARADASILAEQGLLAKGYLLYTGNNRPHKNIPTLLQAFAAVRQQQPELRLVLAGHSGTSTQEGVIYPGFISDEQLVALYQNARALVFPSWYEGFGLPVLEALSNGCPVIAADIAAFREFDNACIRYFPPDEVSTLAELMRQPPVFEPQIAAAVLQKFSWQNTWRNLDRILEGWL